MATVFRRIVDFYLAGFRQMTLGRTLWWLILVKLVIIFAVLRLFFFPEFLDSGQEPQQVSRELLQRATTD